MDAFKQRNNSETSSEEIDQPGKMAKDDNIGTGRSYECSFCKRGFTNAQALGGHMNIHRKDKAKLTKSKQVPTEPSIPNRLNNDMVNSYFPLFMSNQIPHYSDFGSHMSYQTFVPTQNPRFSDMDCIDANLSLGIGMPSYNEDYEDKRRREKMVINIGDDVDLELRLGYNP